MLQPTTITLLAHETNGKRCARQVQ